jgi:hypothetical protein
MNKLNCRGCGKELENCTCDVLTTSKERTTLKLIEIDDYCIICESQHGGECFDIECHIKSRHEGRLSGARQQMEADQLVVNKLEAEIKELKERIESVQTSISAMDEIEIIDCYGHRVKYKKVTLQEVNNG